MKTENFKSVMSKVSLSSASELGQAISGIASVLALIVISITLYLQHTETVTNHNNLQINREIARVGAMIDNLRSDIDNTNFAITQNGTESHFKGEEVFNAIDNALNATADHTNVINSNAFKDLYFICGIVDTTIDIIQKSSLPETERKYYITSLGYLYTSRLGNPLITITNLNNNGKLNINMTDKKARMMAGRVIELHKRMADVIHKSSI
jgi:hypothetical protein